MNQPGGFTPLGEREQWQGQVVSLSVADIRAPDGTTYQREIIRHPGAAVIVPLEGREAIMVRQYRPAVNRHLLEIPAGKLDSPDEPPERTARRELEEEIGKQAGHLELLAVFHNSPGFCDEITHCYLATDLTDTDRQPHSIEERHMAIERVRLDDVGALVASGELADAKSIVGLLLARERLG
ncbi:NUDIX hydrolase [Candidatus Poriferisocius sp.]|uniref:NUDIX hydrolase n=1 Tax=Candidatus Poriferisocius sp. TaxID=3101276 RepID=UPI003B58D1E3